MTTHPAADRLHDLVDGLLPEAEARAVERHLEGCPECRREVMEIRSLLAGAADLPREMTPGRDLWPDIRARLRPRRTRAEWLPAWLTPRLEPRRARPRRLPAWWTPPRLALAASLLLVLGASAVTVIRVVRQRQAAEASGGLEGGRVGLVEFHSAEATYEAATRQLMTALAARRGSLAPETERIVEDNLRIIDEALRKSRSALEADPGNRRLSGMVAATYQTKIDYLRRAISLSL